MTEAKPPAAGIAAGLIHASRENALVSCREVVFGTDTTSFTPSKPVAVLVVS